MTLSKYAMLALLGLAILTYTSKIPADYEGAAAGATVGGLAGLILTHSTPLGIVSGLIIGTMIGHGMEASANNND